MLLIYMGYNFWLFVPTFEFTIIRGIQNHNNQFLINII